MINIIYSEILKLKKSNCMFMALTSALGMVILMNIAILITDDKKRTFESYSYNVGQMNSVMVFSMIFGMIASYMFIREYNDKTASTLYSYPFARIKIFLGKLFVIYMIIVVVYFIQCISIYLSYYKLFGTLEKDQIMLNIKVNVYSMFFQMSSIPIVISNKHLINIELYILNLNLVVIIVDNTKNIVTIPPIFKIVFILLLIAFIKVLPKLFVEILMEFISLLLFLFLFRIIIPKRKLLKK